MNIDYALTLVDTRKITNTALTFYLKQQKNAAKAKAAESA